MGKSFRIWQGLIFQFFLFVCFLHTNIFSEAAYARCLVTFLRDDVGVGVGVGVGVDGPFRCSLLRDGSCPQKWWISLCIKEPVCGVPFGPGCREQSQQAVSALAGFHPYANDNTTLAAARWPRRFTGLRKGSRPLWGNHDSLPLVVVAVVSVTSASGAVSPVKPLTPGLTKTQPLSPVQGK